MTLIERLRKSFAENGPAISQALDLYAAMVDGPVVRVPGADTATRMAERISWGKTPEEAAAREYVYRWGLALRSRVFGVPHALGL